MATPVLVITPSPSFGESIRASLEQTESYRVFVVSNKVPAIVQAEEESCHLAILDLDLGEQWVEDIGQALRKIVPDMKLFVLAGDELPPALDAIRPWTLLRKPFHLPQALVALARPEFPAKSSQGRDKTPRRIAVAYGRQHRGAASHPTYAGELFPGRTYCAQQRGLGLRRRARPGRGAGGCDDHVPQLGQRYRRRSLAFLPPRSNPLGAYLVCHAPRSWNAPGAGFRRRDAVRNDPFAGRQARFAAGPGGPACGARARGCFDNSAAMDAYAGPAGSSGLRNDRGRGRSSHPGDSKHPAGCALA